MNPFKQRLQAVQSDILHAELAAGRVRGSVKLLAVSKTKPPTDMIALYRLGQRHFGENYVQEAIEKQQILSAFAITWHFIGPIQSNKTKLIARHFNWVHSVDRLKIAQRLSEQRPDTLPPLNICLQVNISQEDSKAGMGLNELPDLLRQIQQLPNLRVRGVMAIPEPEDDFNQQREPYRKMMDVVRSIPDAGLDTFSFGMSNDLKAAISEGSNLVRIGTALFGARNYG
jgi:pyridoxal phosphate enzyme (YggS family)